MKRTAVISVLLAMARVMFGGESSLTTTYQPLDGLGSSEIVIVQVTCHDWFSHSGQVTAIGLISAPNVPPTNNPKDATENLNLASVCGVRFVASEIGDSQAPRELMLDATNFVIPKRFGHSRENIIRSCLECLRLCLPDPLRDTPVKLKAADSDMPWLSEIVGEFNAHDRRTVFHNPSA